MKNLTMSLAFVFMLFGSSVHSFAFMASTSATSSASISCLTSTAASSALSSNSMNSRITHQKDLSKLPIQTLSSTTRLTYDDPYEYLKDDSSYSSDINNMVKKLRRMQKRHFERKMNNDYFLTENVKALISIKLLSYLEKHSKHDFSGDISIAKEFITMAFSPRETIKIKEVTKENWGSYFQVFKSFIYDMKEDKNFFIEISRSISIKIHSLENLKYRDLISKEEFYFQKKKLHQFMEIQMTLEMFLSNFFERNCQ